MRPFGLEELAKERALLNPPPYDVLIEEWTRFLELTKNGYDGSYTDVYGPYFEAGIEVLHNRKPTLLELHAHLLFQYVRDEQTGDVGVFTSAGYQLLPQQEIRFPFHMPRLELLGSFLSHKRLIIDGTLGNDCGIMMLGDLVINGTVGNFAGGGMVGRLINNGVAGEELGGYLLGELIDNGVAGKNRGERMDGIIHDHSTERRVLGNIPELWSNQAERIVEEVLAHRFDTTFDQYGNNERIRNVLLADLWRKR
jgi:hypothetical protein